MERFIYDAEEAVPPSRIPVACYNGEWFIGYWSPSYVHWCTTTQAPDQTDPRVVGVTHWFYLPEQTDKGEWR